MFAGGIGLPELLIIGGIVVLLFGAKKLPGLGGAVGESIKNFKKGVKEPKTLEEGKDNKETADSSDSPSKNA